MAPIGAEFGNHMSEEGETSHISSIIILYYSTLAGYTYLCSYATGCSYATIPVYYLFSMGLFYAWHYCAHQPFSGDMYRIHLFHHVKTFPPSNFYGTEPDFFKKKYGTNTPTIWQFIFSVSNAGGKGKFKHEGPLIIAYVSMLFFGHLVFKTSLPTCAFVVFLLAVMASVGNAMHMSFHVKGFHLEKYDWYMELRALHYIHHLGDMRSNLAMVNLGVDGLFHTLAIKDPVKERRRLKESAVEDEKQVAELLSELDRANPHVQQAVLKRVLPAGGLSSMLLGFDLPFGLNPNGKGTATSRGYPTVLLRFFIIALLILLWDTTETTAHATTNKLCLDMGTQGVRTSLHDVGHVATEPLRRWILEGGWDDSEATQQSRGGGHRRNRQQQQQEADANELILMLCGASALLSELIVIVTIVVSVVGTTMRPALAVGIAIILRLLARVATDLPISNESLWQTDPTLPHLFVKPETASSFFSMRVALVTIAYIELRRFSESLTSSRWLSCAVSSLGCAVLSFDVLLSLALEASWTIDVLVAMLVAVYAARVAELASGLTDAFMP